MKLSANAPSRHGQAAVPEVGRYQPFVPSSGASQLSRIRSFPETVSMSTNPDLENFKVAALLAATHAGPNTAVQRPSAKSLLDVLLAAVIDLADAARAMAIVVQGSELSVTAIALGNRGAIDRQFCAAELQTMALPQAIVRRALRSGNEVVIADALSEGPFEDDHYFRSHAVRSIVCLPLASHDTMVGALYIENFYASCGCTLAENGVLKCLAWQMMICLENFRLSNESNRIKECLRQTHSELAHASRVNLMSTLACSVAHEVNQPVTAMASNGSAALHWLDRDPPRLEEVRSSLASIVSAGLRAAAVIKAMRNLLRKTTPLDAGHWSINDLVEETLLLIAGRASEEQTQITTDLGNNLPLVTGDRAQLQQVILNLTLNGLDAIKEAASRPSRLHISSWYSKADGVTVAVQDSGKGAVLNAEHRFFEPFFTTKSDGLGMGLVISRTIVEAHGGRIWASSCSTAGAVFQFALPAHGYSPAVSPL